LTQRPTALSAAGPIAPIENIVTVEMPLTTID
jgi:hypothetical protein